MNSLQSPRLRLLIGGAIVVVVLALGAFALTRRRTPSSDASRNSIAVLAFENFGADPANEFFSEGITDDIITQLSKLDGIKVISRTSSMQYRGRGKSLPQIGQELGVATVLEGSVRRAGGRVRVVAQLIDVHTDEHLWAETYDRDLKDIFAIQTDVSSRIASALGGRLRPSSAASARRPTSDIEAYDLYLRGRYLWNRRRASTIRQAIDYLERATARDSAFALAWAGIADAYVALPFYGSVTVADAYPKAQRAAERALTLDPSLGEAHASLGWVLWYDWKWADAEAQFQQAIALRPGYATAHHWYAEFLSSAGREDESLAEIRRALVLDPLSLILNQYLCGAFHFARRYDEALAQCARTLELDPDAPFVFRRLSWIYYDLNRTDDMIGALGRWWQLSGAPLPNVDSMRATRQAKGDVGLFELLAATPANSSISAVERAMWYLGAKKKDDALRSLEEGFAARDVLIGYLNELPSLDALHDELRYQALVARMGLTRR
jgi:TolB-like protein/Tfp pilus assembly protein PilF